MIIIQPSIELILTENPVNVLKKIEHAGRVCYKSEEKITEDSYISFIKGIIQRGHLAVLEHGSLSVLIKCDRGVTHELVRHRIASYCQESTRYCNYGKQNRISLIPMMDGLSPDQQQRRRDLYARIEQVYLAEILEGVKPQQARDNLPTCLKTEIMVTMNFREWLYFLELRGSKAAHPQIRKIAIMILEEFKRKIPVIFDSLIIKDLLIAKE